MVPPPDKLVDKANLQVRTTTTTTTNSGLNVLQLDTLMGRCEVLAEVVIDLKTKIPTSNNNGSRDAKIEDAHTAMTKILTRFGLQT